MNHSMIEQVWTILMPNYSDLHFILVINILSRSQIASWCKNQNFGSLCNCLFLTVLKVNFLDATLDPNEGTKLDHFESEPTILFIFILSSFRRVDNINF